MHLFKRRFIRKRTFFAFPLGRGIDLDEVEKRACLLTAAVQNLKKIATILHRLGAVFTKLSAVIKQLIYATKPAKLRALSVV